MGPKKKNKNPVSRFEFNSLRRQFDALADLVHRHTGALGAVVEWARSVEERLGRQNKMTRVRKDK